MPHVQAKDGISLYYNDWGTGRPVVFVSSAWLNSQMWEYQLPYLAGHGLRCVSYDRRGHGRSDWPWDGYDYGTLADDLAALIEHLDLREITLIGHSVGGGEIVRYLTRHHSERVSRIVLVAATAPFPMQTDDNPGGIPKSMADAVTAARAADRPRWMAEMTASFFALDLPRNKVSPEFIHWMQDMAVQCSPRASSACFEAGFTTDLRAEMRAITVPTLIIHGDHDAQAQVDICGRKSARLVPDSTFIEYAGAGHGLFITHADRLNADLLKFINS